jgi:single-strand DNA-binding protein
MKTLRNSVQLIGNLGMDPEVKETENGKKLAKFSLATTETYRNKQGEKVSETQWHNLIIWGGLADIAQKFLKKGKQVAVEGKLTNRNYDDKEGKRRYITEIVVNDLVLLSKAG